MKIGDLSLQPNVKAEKQLSTLPAAFWMLALLSGAGAGVGGILLMLLLRTVQHAAWNYTAGNFLEGVESAACSHRWLVVAGAGALVAFGRNFLRWTIGSRGSGVEESLWMHRARLPFWRSLIWGSFSIVLVALGASLGREGAPKQVGAAISSRLAIWKRLRPDQRKILVACGAGAGMATVYNVPFGGALFASEVLLGNISLPLVLPALLTSLIAVTVSWFVLPNRSTYETAIYEVSGELFAGAIVIGVISGLAAIVYIRVISWASAHRPQGWKSYAAPIVVFVLLGGASCIFPQLLGNGKDVVELAFDDQAPFPLSAALVFLRPAATVACLSSGAPGGLFTPTITAGSLIGELIGQLANFVHSDIHIGAWAILGAGAFLGASNKGPLSALILIMELRGHLDGLIVPLMLAISLSTVICHFWEQHSIYTGRFQKKSSAGTDSYGTRSLGS